MKYIVIGLGNFGSALGSMLTDLGHEVIGVDISMHRVEALKENITSTICLDSTDIHALSTLPIKEADIVVVGIGENFGASVMTTSLLIKKGVKRLICRAISPNHQSVFEALKVKEVLHPEKDAAERLINQIVNPGIIDSYQIGQNHMLVEIPAPTRYVGSKVAEIEFKNRFQIMLVAIIKHRSGPKYASNNYDLGQASDFVYPDAVIEKDDVLVLYGNNHNIKRFIGE